MDVKLHAFSWWNYLDKTQQNGLETSIILLEREKIAPNPLIHDFSFIVFPAAKAYEGFLKKLFFDLGFISEHEFNGDRFRIGKALNPSLEKDFRHLSIYDKLAAYCQGKSLPDKLWLVWKRSRNSLFHWWPSSQLTSRNGIDKNFVLTVNQTEERLKEIIEAIDMAFRECKVKTQKS